MNGLITERIIVTEQLLGQFQGKILVHGIVIMSSDKIMPMFDIPGVRKKTVNLFQLGMSLAPILKLSNSPEYSQLLIKLMERIENSL
jgi:hypothetical protein